MKPFLQYNLHLKEKKYLSIYIIEYASKNFPLVFT